MQLTFRFGRSLLLLSFLCLGGQTVAEILPVRFVISAELVAGALQGQGLSVLTSQLEVPTGLTASVAQPELRLTGSELLPNRRLRLRLTCVHAEDCHAFFVLAREVDITASVPPAVRVPSAANRSALQDSAGSRLLAGQRITLLLTDAHMQITIPVMAIDSGAPGSEIRVSSLDRKRTFQATVLDPRTVRSELP